MATRVTNIKQQCIADVTERKGDKISEVKIHCINNA